MNPLKTYRKKIDKIDNKIIRLLDKRLIVAQKIGEYKKQNNLPITNLNREKEILNKFSKKTKKTKLKKNFINKLFNLIFKNSKDVQK